MRRFEACVIGVGGMGSASTYHLAKRGVKVLSLEQFGVAHSNGSSHGKTRMTRTAYAEHPSYVPLVKRATELYFELAKSTGLQTILINGGLMVGRPDCSIIVGPTESAKIHSLPFKIMSRREVIDAYPVFVPSEDEVGFFDPGAGIVFPENCIQGHVNLAAESGAQIHLGEPALGWKSDGALVRVKSGQDEYEAEKLVIAAGSWAKGLITDFELPVSMERQVVFWFDPKKGEDRPSYSPENMPVFGWLYPDGRIYYGFPDFGDGVKAAIHHEGEAATPQTLRRTVDDNDERVVRSFLRDHIPGVDVPARSSVTCIYTNTPDRDFLIDFHPAHKNVLIVSPCSGHGFKFTSAIGEAVSELVTSGGSHLDLSRFSLGRLNAPIAI
jgi:sarcosine oxidase